MLLLKSIQLPDHKPIYLSTSQEKRVNNKTGWRNIICNSGTFFLRATLEAISFFLSFCFCLIESQSPAGDKHHRLRRNIRPQIIHPIHPMLSAILWLCNDLLLKSATCAVAYVTKFSVFVILGFFFSGLFGQLPEPLTRVKWVCYWQCVIISIQRIRDCFVVAVVLWRFRTAAERLD